VVAQYLPVDPNVISKSNGTFTVDKQDCLGCYRRLMQGSSGDLSKAEFAQTYSCSKAFGQASLTAIFNKLCNVIIVGEADQTAPAATNASYFTKHITGAELTILEKVGHSFFWQRQPKQENDNFPRSP
jgi:pimeloyl-ACP methyl ester carboxylesterase